MTESKCDGWQIFSEFLNLKTSKTCSGPNLYRKCIWLLDLPLWNINKDLFCCRTFGMKVWTWVGDILNLLFFLKVTFFLNVRCCPNIVDETLILSIIVWKKYSEKFSCIFFLNLFLTSYFSLLLLLPRMQNCAKDNTAIISKK